MGIGTLIEEVAGAIAAEQAAEKLDPGAGLLVKAAAAIAGFEGVAKVTEALGSHAEAAAAIPPEPASADAPTASETGDAPNV